VAELPDVDLAVVLLPVPEELTDVPEGLLAVVEAMSVAPELPPGTGIVVPVEASEVAVVAGCVVAGAEVPAPSHADSAQKIALKTRLEVRRRIPCLSESSQGD